MAVGDFNGDGHPDLAVANYGDGTVSVLLGKGDGTFQTQQTYPVGSEPQSVAVGDFNGDGHPDLAVANYGDNTVSILLGKGDGTFQPQHTYTVGSEPQSVAVGDFNGDGKPDLAVVNAADGTVSVLLGNGTFQAEHTYAVGYAPNGVAVGDFNGDGKLDLAVANEADGTVSVLLGNGDGTFQSQHAYSVGAQRQSVVAGDFNGDGQTDLAVANNSDGTVSVLAGNGDGTFGTQRTYAVGQLPQGVATGDFNGDGKIDLAVVNSQDGTVSILVNNSPTVVGTKPTSGATAGGGSSGGASFNDLDGYDWAAGAIETLAGEGIIKGTGPNTFDPAGQITRVQFAALMQRTFSLSAPAQPVSFSDVDSGGWEYAPVEALTPYMDYSQGPGGGYAFHPDQAMDRQDVATVLVKILAADNKLQVLSAGDAQTVLGSVTDASDIAPAVRTYVATAIKAGLIKGFPDGTFQPLGSLTRAQVAVLIQRLQTSFLVNSSS